MEKKFRLRGKNFFLTFPQCPEELTKEYLKETWSSQWLNLTNMTIGEERHDDGGKHFHILLQFPKAMDIIDPSYFDIILSENKVLHGNYQVAKNMKAVKNYVRKEGNILQLYEEEKEDPKIEKNKKILGLAEKHGVPYLLEEGLISLKEYCWVNNGYETYKKQKIEKLEEREDLDSRLENPWGININIDIDTKKTHYWIWSHAPNLGKTTWLLGLHKKYKSYFWNLIENYQNGIFRDCQLILVDEFRGQMKISMLNSICDGTLQIPRKNLSSIQLDQKPVVIIMGNKEPNLCYKADYIQYIEARFNIIEINSFV